MTTFNDLPLARKEPDHLGNNVWTATYVVPLSHGSFTYATVRAVVHPDKATELRFKQVQRGSYMLGQLVDAQGVIYGVSGTHTGGPAQTGEDEVMLSRVDVARARLIDLASAWRRAGLQLETENPYAAQFVAYSECARQLNELVIELLPSREEVRPDAEAV